MVNIFNEHFRDFVNALSENKVEYVLVGAIAVIFHGFIWVNFIALSVNK